jgi:hypothetical protein
MLYQDIISSNKLPTDFANYYTPSNDEPTITQQGESRIVKTKIQWNKKEYEFTWTTGLSNKEDILNQLNTKINTMLALGILYNLGEKTTSLEYNPSENIVKRYDHEKLIKATNLNFDDLLHNINSKIKDLTADKTQIAALQSYQTLKKVIEWTKRTFQTLNKNSSSASKASDPLQKLESIRIEKAREEKEAIALKKLEDEKKAEQKMTS